MDESIICRAQPKLFRDGNFKIYLLGGEGYEINYGEIYTLKITCFVEGDFRGGAVLGDFSSFLVTIPAGIEGRSVRIKDKISGNTIGYLFSLQALSDPDAGFEGYEAGYAKAAIEHVLFDGVGSKSIDFDGNNVSRSVDFESLFYSEKEGDGEKVIAVVSKALCPDTNSLLVSMARFGARFHIIDDFHYHPDMFSEISSLPVLNIPEHISESGRSIFLLLHMAGEQPDPFSRFVSLYQIVEILIVHVFKAELKKFIANCGDSDPWESKERLIDMTKEESRIKKLYQDYLDRSVSDHSEFSECIALCGDFISKYIQEGYSKKDWASCIYKIRNSIVHNSASLVVRDQNDGLLLSEMNNVAASFLKCCVSMILGSKNESGNNTN